MLLISKLNSKGPHENTFHTSIDQSVLLTLRVRRFDGKIWLMRSLIIGYLMDFCAYHSEADCGGGGD